MTDFESFAGFVFTPGTPSPTSKEPVAMKADGSNESPMRRTRSPVVKPVKIDGVARTVEESTSIVPEERDGPGRRPTATSAPGTPTSTSAPGTPTPAGRRPTPTSSPATPTSAPRTPTSAGRRPTPTSSPGTPTSAGRRPTPTSSPGIKPDADADAPRPTPTPTPTPTLGGPRADADVGTGDAARRRGHAPEQPRQAERPQQRQGHRNLGEDLVDGMAAAAERRRLSRRPRVDWSRVVLPAEFSAARRGRAYVISAALPGLDASSVRLVRRGVFLSIQALRPPSPAEQRALERSLVAHLEKLPRKRLQTMQQEDVDELAAQRGRGSFGLLEQEFRLPGDVDWEGLECLYEEGVLRVVLPRAALTA